MVTNEYYTKTIQFDDINYQLADTAEQEMIFNRYCNFLNQFDTGVDIQFTFQNKIIDMQEYKKHITLPKKSETEKISKLKAEYQQMLYDQFAKHTNTK